MPPTEATDEPNASPESGLGFRKVWRRVPLTLSRR
jgi:hypothetical protein